MERERENYSKGLKSNAKVDSSRFIFFFFLLTSLEGSMRDSFFSFFFFGRIRFGWKNWNERLYKNIYIYNKMLGIGWNESRLSRENKERAKTETKTKSRDEKENESLHWVYFFFSFLFFSPPFLLFFFRESEGSNDIIFAWIQDGKRKLDSPFPLWFSTA